MVCYIKSRQNRQKGVKRWSFHTKKSFMNETIILDIFLDIKYDMYLKFKMKNFIALQEEIESHIFAIFKLFFPTIYGTRKYMKRK